MKPDGRRWGRRCSTDEFTRVMITNALGPLRVIQTLQDRVEPAGTIAVVSSGQGSVASIDDGSIPNGPGWDCAGHAGVWGGRGHWSRWRRCGHWSWTGARTRSGHGLVIVASGQQARG